MALEEDIAERAKEIRTDGYAMSIGEVISLYRDNDIEVHPEFQRIFRWNPSQKSRLIESILLGIPIPSIFVAQRDDGVWDVIDGVQRLSTILEFVGVYRNHTGEIEPPLVLEATEYLPNLAGYRWESIDSDQDDLVFPDSLKRAVKRARIEFRIVQKESDPNAKYDLFQRLNSGAELSPQEARNCLMVMLNSSMFNEIVELSRGEHFLATTPISDRKDNEAYRQELVLRFFCQADYKGGDSELAQEYGDYLTGWMRGAAKAFDSPYNPIDRALFNRVFSLLDATVGDDAFRRYDAGRHLGPFSISCFEFVTAGLAANVQFWEDHRGHLAEKIRSVWGAPEFRSNSGTGVSPRRRVPKLVNGARIFFSEL